MNNKQVKTLREALDTSGTLFSERPALTFVGGKPLTYAKVHSLARQLMAWLSDNGIQKGDRVILLSQNMPHWGVAYLAVTSMGAVVVPILTDFNEAELNKIIAHSEAKAILVSEKLSVKINKHLPASVNLALLLDTLTPFSLEKLKNDRIIEMKDAVKTVEPSREFPKPAEEDLAAILYTSGTTGNPKGVMLSHRNLVSNAINTLGIQNVDLNDRLLSVLPLPHTYECTIGFIIPFIGGAVVYYLEKPPTASVLLPAMKEVKPTMMLTVPLIIEKVYNAQVKPKLHKSKLMRGMMKVRFMRRFFHRIAGKKIYNAFGGHLHFFGIGGAKVSAETERFLRDAGFPYAIGYGLTETAPLLAGCAPSLTKYRSTGFNLPNQEMKILNPDPHTGEGEIVAKGPNVMMGYFKDPVQTAEVFTLDGWFKTGDLGVLDKDNYLYIKGRLKNMILGPSGENIYPEEIEALINGEDLVLESLVYELKGQLVAKVHLNYEELEKRYQDLKDSAQDYKERMNKAVDEKLNEIREKVNATMNRFSRISAVEEQPVPFEKTPTQKIKRFLYSKHHDLKH
ncbi:MAG: AMP-binding protein [Bacteroidales bacterium]|jgi:long-chain acyl-CoA synthetase|nr:AMP-binding protein [Bacteroidales bacterium]